MLIPIGKMAISFLLLGLLGVALTQGQPGQPIPGRVRMRREIRDLPPEEWDRVVEALWIMKRVGQTEGLRQYGPQYKSYDALVVQHMSAALNSEGDLGHFSPVFPIFHRLFILQFENSLIAIDPQIQGLPYWNCFDRGGEIFSPRFFGSFVGRGNNFEVNDGRFANWNVPFSEQVDPPASVSNVYGYLRGPLNPNPSPVVTRRGGSLCGIDFGFGEPRDWGRCLQAGNTLWDWYECADGGLHGRAHMAIGGSWQRASQRGQQDQADCSQWYGIIGNSIGDINTVPRRQRGSFINAAVAQPACFDCQCCTVDMDPDTCICRKTAYAQQNGCGPLWTNLPSPEQQQQQQGGTGQNFRARLADDQNIQFIGDFLDVGGSANDPIFMFHHANVERHFTAWMDIQTQGGSIPPAQLQYLQYPTSGLVRQCNLDDVMSERFPFRNLYGENDAAMRGYTVREALDVSVRVRMYQYDTYEVAPGGAGLGSAGSFDMDMGMGTGMMDSASLEVMSGNVDLMAGQAATAATEFSQVSPFRRLTEGEDKGEGGGGVDVTGATSTGTQEASTGSQGQGGGTTVRTTVSPASTKTQTQTQTQTQTNTRIPPYENHDHMQEQGMWMGMGAGIGFLPVVVLSAIGFSLIVICSFQARKWCLKTPATVSVD